jgi:signal transduction histidine kinase
VLIHDDSVATHLYHIAQEAVNNAIKHGEAGKILIQLTAGPGRGKLTIKDDGKGMPDGLDNSSGMGLHIMKYRSAMIGGALEIRSSKARGTSVICSFPVKDRG